MAGEEVEITGLRELEARLLRLQGKVSNTVVRKALRKAGNVVVKAAKAKVEVDSGALRESIGTIARKGKGTNFQTMFVGSRAKNKAALALANAERPSKFRDGTTKRNLAGIFYGHMVERGTKRGHAAQPFLRPALDENYGEVVRTFERELKKEIDKAEANNDRLPGV